MTVYARPRGSGTAPTAGGHYVDAGVVIPVDASVVDADGFA